MRADTHDGPEQMLHVRGLIHCCSSHVRRSWNSVLQRTAGPYIMAPNRPAGVSGLWSLLGAKRTWLGHSEIDAIDPKATSPLSPPSSPSRASKVSPAVWTRTSRRDKLRAGYRNRERCEAAWVAAGSKTMNELTRRRLFQAAIVTVF